MPLYGWRSAAERPRRQARISLGRRLGWSALVAAVTVAALATAGSAGGQGLSRAEVRRQVALLETLGHALFYDPALSASGKMACASCHDPAHGFSAPNALPVQLGGGNMQQPGVRDVPSLTYLQAVPPFTEHFFESEDDADESIDNGPTGGLTWDGRVDRGRDQAGFPLTSPYEMANKDDAAVAARVLAGGYGDRIAAIGGDPAVLADPKAVYETAVHALEVYEQDEKTFYPYSSKYDAYLAGKATLTAQEANGLSLFNAVDKGNCASCHISQRGLDGTPPQFTDYGQIAIGVPRNAAIPANRDPNYFDLGLCGPLRTDFLKRKDYCGLFRTPSLRNVALRQSFFHNGYFHTLRDAVEFYVERDTDPAKYYPRNPDGSINKYDDLPDYAKANVNTDPPFDRHPGEAPTLNPAEIDDVVAFLGTLTDGYRPPAPLAADSAAGQSGKTGNP